MIGFEYMPENESETLICDELVNFEEGDTLKDVLPQLEDTGNIFLLRTTEEYYRRKTKNNPRCIDICIGEAQYTYNEFINSPDFEKYKDAKIKKVELDEASSYNGEDFFEMLKTNTVHKYVAITLDIIKLPDTTTPRHYSLTAL